MYCKTEAKETSSKNIRIPNRRRANLMSHNLKPTKYKNVYKLMIHLKSIKSTEIIRKKRRKHK